MACAQFCSLSPSYKFCAVLSYQMVRGHSYMQTKQSAWTGGSPCTNGMWIQTSALFGRNNCTCKPGRMHKQKSYCRHVLRHVGVCICNVTWCAHGMQGRCYCQQQWANWCADLQCTWCLLHSEYCFDPGKPKLLCSVRFSLEQFPYLQVKNVAKVVATLVVSWALQLD